MRCTQVKAVTSACRIVHPHYHVSAHKMNPQVLFYTVFSHTQTRRGLYALCSQNQMDWAQWVRMDAAENFMGSVMTVLQITEWNYDSGY